MSKYVDEGEEERVRGGEGKIGQRQKKEKGHEVEEEHKMNQPQEGGEKEEEEAVAYHQQFNEGNDIVVKKCLKDM